MIRKELILKANEELEDMNDEEIEEEGFDKDELEHDVVSGPTNLPTKKLKSCQLASKSKKVLKSLFKKTIKKAKNQW
jgi:hypothetical protein